MAEKGKKCQCQRAPMQYSHSVLWRSVWLMRIGDAAQPIAGGLDPLGIEAALVNEMIAYGL